MKNLQKSLHGIRIVALIVLAGGLIPTLAETAFTYQGRLKVDGSPATGVYDLQFSLYDAASGGSQVGSALTFEDEGITNGLVSVNLDFGINIFTGADRWIEVALRPGLESGAFATLTPRRPLKPTPYAITAGNLSGSLPDTQLSTNIPQLNGNPTFTGSVSFNPASGAPFAVGNSNKVNNLNADLLDGLSSGALWQLGGNSGTTAGMDYLGTTDNQALELKVNNARVLRLEPSLQSPNVIGGYSGNEVVAGIHGATIGGGGATASGNSIAGSWSTIGGGRGNTIQTNARNATISGGNVNIIKSNADDANIGGGLANTIQTNASRATIGGGFGNTIGTNAQCATIPGGQQNEASGDHSFAAGQGAVAKHCGTFVWSDSGIAHFFSTGSNQFLIHASGGVGIGTNDPATALHVAGTITADAFSGNGSGLTNVARLDVPNVFTHDQVIANGKVGIGTYNPQAKLHVLPSNAGASSGILLGSLETGSTALRIDLSRLSDGHALLQGIKSAGLEWGDMILNQFGGRVGIGMDNPSALLSLGTGLANTKLALWDDGDTNRLFGLGIQGSQFRLHLGSSVSRFSFLDAPDGKELLTIKGNGMVGVGTANPSAGLHIESGASTNPALKLSSRSATYGSGISLENSRGGATNTWAIYNYSGTDELIFGHQETGKDIMRLKANGITSVNVLEITGGGDIAEPFDVVEQNEILPGQVVCINPRQPGSLLLSTKAYDPTVAGIISGANGIRPGMVLRQENTMADGVHPVALTGRVWCWCDAKAGGSIQPGDLLTTADTPGHAMKAVDREKAFGAILGKAMSSLNQGQGLVLVLVSLQ